ncbi:MAG: hypothetical protein ABH879_05940 [archaeon]
MKSLVFDAGPVISLGTNNLFWILDPLKKRFGGQFWITPSVKNELVDRPLNTKKYEFEALQVLSLIRKRTLAVVERQDIIDRRNVLLDYANSIYIAKGHEIKILHSGEMESLAAAKILGSDAMVVDERTLRYLIEKPQRLRDRLENKLHTQVTINIKTLKDFTNNVGDVKLIRSTELVTVAFQLGLLDYFLAEIPNAKRRLLHSVLWGVKLRGCAISRSEIRTILNLTDNEC